MSVPKPKITSSFKKKVKKDWHTQLPSFTIREKTFNLSRVVGPLLITIGFGVPRGNEDYEPNFGVHNLCNIEEALYSMLDEPLRTIRTNGPDSITVRGHEAGKYLEAAERMKTQAYLPLEGTISVSMIWEAYRKYHGIHPNSGLIDQLQDPALIAAWAGRPDIAQKALDWGYGEFLKWPENLQYDPDYGSSPEAWRASMEERIAHPEVLRKISKQEIIKHNLTYIPQEELIPE